jgi:hypothetical protein
MATKCGAEIQKTKNSTRDGCNMWGGIAKNEESNPRWLQYVGRYCKKQRIRPTMAAKCEAELQKTKNPTHYGCKMRGGIAKK